MGAQCANWLHSACRRSNTLRFWIGYVSDRFSKAPCTPRFTVVREEWNSGRKGDGET